MKRNIKKMALAAMLAGMLGGLTGCFIQPDPTLDPLQISDGTVPFGTVQALPTNTPTPVPQNTPTPTPDTWQSSDQSTWEDWSGGSLPTTTPKTAATVAPGAQSWQTSTQDYNAGYPVLRVGSTGSDVSDLQARLTELGYYTGTIDGKYSTGTQSAVTEFQSRNGLTADGIAGRATQDKLYSASAQPKTVSASAVDSGYTLLKEGASGLDVRKLQGRLAELGYYAGGVDGIYGSTTTSAVKAFQKANGLGADGIAGKGTMNKLNSGNAVAAETTDDDIADEPETTYQPETAYTVLRRGDKSDQVEVMQRYLATLGYLSTTPDGQFGSGTERAVKLFQEANGLRADGVAGSGTLSILYSGSAVSYNAYFGASGGSTTVSPTAVPDMTTVIQWESEGDNVRQYQQRLVELGYLNSKYVTGKFNQKTVEATKAFQTMNDLKVDGAAGPQSLKLIYSGDALDANGVRVGDKLSSASDTVTVSAVLTAGMSGEQVRQVQSRLAALGYLSASFISGAYDEATAQAVRQFQQANGLTADGAAGSATQSRLYASNAVTAQVARASADNSERQSAEYRVNGAYQASLAGGGIAVGDRNALYCADASQGGILVKKPYNGAAASVMAYDVPRFLHLTNGKLYYVASEGGEDCVIRLNTQSGSREVLARVGVALKFALCDGVMYMLDANAALKERTLSGEESELMTGVSDFTLDATGKALLCVTQDGVVSFGIQTGQSEMVYTGAADQAAMCGQALLVRAGGSIVRVMNGQMATIRRDGATCLFVYGQKVIELTGRGVMTCDVNGENATTIANGSFEAASIANGVLYLGGADGYTQSVSL